MTAIDESGFVALTRAVSTRAGLALGAYKEKCVQRRIAVRMRACGVHTYGDYLALLEQTPAELDRLTDTLTINVTRFFRNAETWHAVRAIVLPALGREPGSGLRAWSAGCSSGEEPYSLAVLAAQWLEEREDWPALGRLQIDATDIDRASLQRAEQGWYRPETVADVPPELLTRHFTMDGDGFRVNETLRSRVRVRRVDLNLQPPLRQDYDLILCRNVLIYFDRATQERLCRVFDGALAPGGYLVLGKVETLFGEVRDRFTLVDARERIYRRCA
ncbi:MAG: protein-glutamate O-methyltransferase CheR [Gemmatimonadales bacterium]|nr:protein-glutamate O-methyltransferase CheR [Gemmatimonadales bacterium]